MNSEEGMNNIKRITHVVSMSGFTTGYINFFKTQMPEYEHYFIICRSYSININPVDDKRIIIVDSCIITVFHKKLIDLLDVSDLVIVSGLFEWNKGIAFLPQRIMKKLYIQFWGGDFYEIEKHIPVLNLKKRISQSIRIRNIKRCKGCLFLIEGEAEKFESVTGRKKESYIATVPGNPTLKITNKPNCNEQQKVNILIGNSSTETNQHIDAFKMLKHMDLSNAKIYVPLSYGDEMYKKRVITAGKEILGDAFFPMTEYMLYEEYMGFLSTIDVAIFNNNRQQAMGNINTLLSYGKKVYLRTDTSMWKAYRNKGYIIYPVESIFESEYSDFVKVDKDKMRANMEIFDEKSGATYDINVWRKCIKEIVSI